MNESILTPAPGISANDKGATLNPANSEAQRMALEVTERTRIPMSVPQARLSSPEIPGFHTHWMNDYPGRIEQALNAGYTFVDREEALLVSPDLAGVRLGSGTDLGSRVSLVVGQDKFGQPLRAYLMKIRLDWFVADQAKSQAQLDEMDSAIKRGRQHADDDDPSSRYVKTHERRLANGTFRKQ